VHGVLCGVTGWRLADSVPERAAFCASDRVLNSQATSSQTSRRTPSPASSLSTMRVRHFTVRIPTLHRQALLLAHDGTFGLLKADEQPNLASEQDRIR